MKFVCAFLFLVVAAVSGFKGSKRGMPDTTVTVNKDPNRGADGTVLLFALGSVGVACADGGENIAKVVCKGETFKSLPSTGEQPEWENKFTCTGNEASINECDHEPFPVGFTKLCSAYLACE